MGFAFQRAGAGKGGSKRRAKQRRASVVEPERFSRPQENGRGIASSVTKARPLSSFQSFVKARYFCLRVWLRTVPFGAAERGLSRTPHPNMQFSCSVYPIGNSMSIETGKFPQEKRAMFWTPGRTAAPPGAGPDGWRARYRRVLRNRSAGKACGSRRLTPGLPRARKRGRAQSWARPHAVWLCGIPSGGGFCPGGR